MEPHSVPNDLYRGLHCGPDSRFLDTPAQAPLPPKCSTLLHLLSSNLCLFVLIYSSLSIRPYLFVPFWSSVCPLVQGTKRIQALKTVTLRWPFRNLIWWSCLAWKRSKIYDLKHRRLKRGSWALGYSNKIVIWSYLVLLAREPPTPQTRGRTGPGAFCAPSSLPLLLS